MVDPAKLIPVTPAAEYERRKRRAESSLSKVWDLLDDVLDPEVPALSLWDLGVLQDIRQDASGVVVIMTPTYSGCPAIEAMCEDILAKLRAANVHDARIEISLTPAWTTDWLSASAQRKLLEYGISPPVFAGPRICPQCGSDNSEMVSEFGSTACKALYRCRDCLEPFDYFKSL